MRVVTPKQSISDVSCAFLIFLLLYKNLLWNIRVEASQINLNIRSSALSDALGTPLQGSHSSNEEGKDKQKYEASSDPSSQNVRRKSVSVGEKERRRQRGGVALDLSGQFNCLITAPRQISSRGIEEDDGRAPLFRVGATSNSRLINPPSFHAGAQYDFSTVWYGATRLLATLTWRGRQILSDRLLEDTDLAVNPPRPLEKIRSVLKGKFSACSVIVRTEKGLLIPDDYTAELNVVFPSTESQQDGLISSPRYLSIRLDTEKSSPRTTLSVSAPIHRRVNIISKSTVLFDEPNAEEKKRFPPSYLASRIPQWSSEGTDDSWIPDLRLSTTGHLVSKSELGLKPRGHSKGDERKASSSVGVRLTISKQLNWSAWGGSAAADDGDTSVRLELCGVNPTRDGITSVTFEGTVERILDTARVTLSQEQLIHSR